MNINATPLAEKVRRIDPNTTTLTFVEKRILGYEGCIRYLFYKYVPDAELGGTYGTMLEEAGCQPCSALPGYYLPRRWSWRWWVWRARSVLAASTHWALAAVGAAVLGFVGGMLFAGMSDTWFPRIYAVFMSIV